jgi:Thermostable hemolysin
MSFVVVARSSGLRKAVESAVRRRYWTDHAAYLRSFPDVLVAEVNSSGIVECAAGIRFGHQALFSEHYLDLPVELALRREIGHGVDRARVVEVCHLVAARAGQALPFVWGLVEFVRAAEAEWAIFTATRFLRHLLRRSGVDMIELARAERDRVPDTGDWGSYFARDPRVMAVSRLAVAGPKRLRPAAAAGVIADA